jgi:hypothetical protein
MLRAGGAYTAGFVARLLTAMQESPVQRALSAATAAFVVAVAAFAMLLPPLSSHMLDSVLRTTFIALVLAAALFLHWIFLAIAVRRLGRSVAGWVALSVVLCPIGSVAALVLLHWLRDEETAARAA